jgi:hypothetical protein
MVKMELRSKSEDFQASKLNEYAFVAHRIRKVGRGVRLGLSKFKCNELKPSGGGGARAASLTSSENPFSTNGSIGLPAQGSSKTPLVPSTFLLGILLSERGENT